MCKVSRLRSRYYFRALTSCEESVQRRTLHWDSSRCLLLLTQPQLPDKSRRCFTSSTVLALSRQQPQQQTKQHVKENVGYSEKLNALSARKLFQQIPVHASILEHIRSIGVGIVPRDTSGRNKQRNRHTMRFSHHYNTEQVADSNQKNTKNINRPVQQQQPRQRGGGRPLQHERQKQRELANNNNHNHNSTSTPNPDISARNADWTWMPPPPFGPKSLQVQMIGSVGPDAPENTTDAATSNLQNSKQHTVAAAPTQNLSTTHSFPKNLSQIPEIALMGRSNVGKSTLLNALLYGNRDAHNVIRPQHKQRGHVPNNMKLPKGIKAVMSSKPGETKHISFYKLQHIQDRTSRRQQQQQQSNRSTEDDNNHANHTLQVATNIPPQPKQEEHKSLLLVDLPGYGFAYAKESHALAYRTLMCNYLLHRGKTLQRVLLLIDARHGMKKADLDFISMLEEQQAIQQQLHHNADRTSRKNYTIPFPIQIVLTKCDLVQQGDLARRVTQVRQQFSDITRREPGQLPIMLVSARAGVGYNNVDPKRCTARGGVLELQKELAALAQPRVIVAPTNRTTSTATKLKVRVPNRTPKPQYTVKKLKSN
jgi:GTP-binding protein